MKITSLISASAIALALAAPVYAQTAPAATTPAATTPAATTPAATTPAATTPAATTPAATTPAATTPAPAAAAGNPTAFATVPAVQQVDAQLAAQGYTITDVVKNANGSYSILSKSPTGQLRLITINPATGGVNDTVTAGVPTGAAAAPAGMPAVSPEGTFEHEANETGAMEGMESGGNDNNGNDRNNDGGSNDRNDRNNNGGSNDSGSNDGGNNDRNDSQNGGSDSDD